MNAFHNEENIRYTTDDIEALPEGKRAELVDGEMYLMAAPTRRHQRMLGELYYAISSYIKNKGGKCEVDQAPFAVYLFNDKYNYFEPDISVICDPDKLDDKGCHGAPDWIIEIVSPGSQRMDYMLKLFKYEKAGVKEYWIVDIDKEQVRVYDFAHELADEYSLGSIVNPGIYEDLEIDFAEIMKSVQV